MAKTLVLIGMLLMATIAGATDLLGVYQDAWQNSPLPKNYLATHLATSEGTPIALGALLPQVTVTGNGSGTKVSQPGFTSRYPSMGYNISITQPLFNYSSYANWAEATDNSNAAAATYQSNLQNFILSVANAYFNVILAEENVDFAQAQVKSLSKNLDQTKDQFEVGISTYTDLLQAKANYVSAVATLIANQNALDNANQNLTELTGKPESNLAQIKNNFPFVPPVPNDMNTWVHNALQNNQALAAQHDTTRAALANVNQTVGNQLPTVSLVASYGQTFYRQTIPAQISSSPEFLGVVIGLQLNWTVFAGGEQMATSLQAANQYASSQNTELNLYRQTTMQTQQDFLSVLANISQVDAYQASVKAAVSSLNDYNAEYKAGTATIVDVLNANQTLYQANSNLATAVNGYITSLLQLKYDAGSLNKSDLASLNQYLQVTH